MMMMNIWHCPQTSFLRPAWFNHNRYVPYVTESRDQHAPL